MRQAPHRCTIYGGKTTYTDLPCVFSFLDAVKSEALFGAQESKGSLLIPLFVTVPEEGRFLDDYRVILLSPKHPRVDQPMLIDTIKWNRNHQSLILSIPNVASRGDD